MSSSQCDPRCEECGCLHCRCASVATATDTAAAPPLLQWSSQAVLDVAAERRRQIEAEGWTPEHDDEHGDGSLAVAASCLADTERTPGLCPGRWPWPASAWKSKGRRHDLVRAGALILAEIERLDRAKR